MSLTPTSVDPCLSFPEHLSTSHASLTGCRTSLELPSVHHGDVSSEGKENFASSGFAIGIALIGTGCSSSTADSPVGPAEAGGGIGVMFTSSGTSISVVVSTIAEPTGRKGSRSKGSRVSEGVRSSQGAIARASDLSLSCSMTALKDVLKVRGGRRKGSRDATGSVFVVEDSESLPRVLLEDCLQLATR